MSNLVVWRSFAWSFGIFVFGHLWRFHSVICDLQIIVCCLKPPIMSQILRKQCVNILFLLGVFYNIQRKSHFRKTLIFSTLSKQWNIMEYHFAILIIWRSQVQALAGPLNNRKAVTPWRSCFFLYNTINYIKGEKRYCKLSHTTNDTEVFLNFTHTYVGTLKIR